MCPKIQQKASNGIRGKCDFFMSIVLSSRSGLSSVQASITLKLKAWKILIHYHF